eukprot:860260-Lingulodinium_polyedra.AAC.1
MGAGGEAAPPARRAWRGDCRPRAKGPWAEIVRSGARLARSRTPCAHQFSGVRMERANVGF